MQRDDLTIRPALAADAATLAGLRSAAVPYLVGTAAGMRSRLADEEVSGAWLAALGGTPAGFALTRVPHEGSARVTLVVHPDHVRQGVGSALLGVVEPAIVADGGSRANAVADGPAGREFAIAHGYEVDREHRFSAADIGAAPAPPTVPPGIELRPLTEVDPRTIWALHHEVGPDDPSGMFKPQSFEVWYAEDWAFPDHAADLGVAAFETDEAIAFTHVFADRERRAIWSAMTGVHPAHRGRGLARLVKAHALQAAGFAGMIHAYTANDTANAPMLAVNSWLGYRPTAQAWSVHGQIGAGGLRH